MRSYKLVIILFFALFITMSFADPSTSFQQMNDQFQPHFWEDADWMCDNALDLCFPWKVLKPEYTQSLSSSDFNDIQIISDLSLLNNYPDAKSEITIAQTELSGGQNSFEVFSGPTCIDVASVSSLTGVVGIIKDCERRGGRITSRGCKVREGNETEYYPYGIESACVFEYLELSEKYQNVLTRYTNTLEHSAKAANYIYSNINTEFLQLKDLGAGYENYYGGARQTYTEAKQIYDSVSFQETNGTTYNIDGISYQYSTAHQEIISIREELLDTPNGPNFQFLNTLPIDINSLAGRNNSLILKGIELHFNLISAQQIIIDEFETLNSETENNKETASNSLDSLDSEKIDLIDSIPTEYMISDIETPEDLNSTEYLDWQLTNISHNLKIVEQEANSNYEQVKNYKTNGDNNLGEGIEKLTIANSKYIIIINESSFLLSEFENLNSWMEENARNKLSECELKLQNTTQSSRAFALLYKTEAEQFLETDESTIGEQYIVYLNSYDKSRECINICEGKEVFSSFDSLLSKFDRILTAAEKDDLDVFTYREWYNFYTDYNYGIGNFILIENDINNFINNIYTLAYSEYEEELTSKRSQIKQSIYSMYSYEKSLKTEKNMFEKWESYYNADGSVDYEKALGHLKEILLDYNSILDSLETERPNVLQEKFESEYTIQKIWKTIPVIDEPVDLDILVTFQNPTELSYDSSIFIEIPFEYEVYTSDIVSKSEDIYRVSDSGDNLLIEFSKIGSRETYNIKFHFDEKLFRRLSKSETIIESTDEYKKIRKVVTFDADVSTDLLYSFEEIPIEAVNCSTEINGISKETHNLGLNAKIELIDIEKERKIYHFYYILENRSITQEISQESYQDEYEDILEETQSLNETAQLLFQNNLTQESSEILTDLDEIEDILSESQKDYDLGKYADAFDKLKEARNITENFDLFSSLDYIKESLTKEFNSLSSVWIRSGDKDPETTSLMSKIEDNLVKLRSLTLSKEDIPLLGETQKLLDSLTNKIHLNEKSTLTGVSSEIIYAKSISNNFENTIYPNYKNYYNSLRSFKVEDNLILTFPYKLTDLDAKLKSIKRTISDIEDKIDGDPELLLLDLTYLSEFRESVKEFNITKNGVELIVSNVHTKTQDYINKTQQAIIILNKRDLGADGNSKLSTLTEEINTAKENLERDNLIEAFKTSSKAYYDSLRLLSGTNPITPPEEEGSLILLIGSASLILMVIIGALFFFKGKKPEKKEEIVLTKLKRE